MERRARTAQEIALRFLTGRAASSSEVRQMLVRKGIPADVAAETVRRLEGLGYIDDSKFAADWAAARSDGGSRTVLGKRGIQAGLTRRGIDPEMAMGAAETAMSPEQELRAASELVLRRSRVYAHLDAETRTRRLWSYLSRRGFGTSTIARVLRVDELDPDRS